jgi:hypothetical protein
MLIIGAMVAIYYETLVKLELLKMFIVKINLHALI